MSLDVYLNGPSETVPCRCRDCGHEHTTEDVQFFSSNITHNLGEMASEAGIYDCCWRPDECGIDRAGQMIAPLREGLAKLRADPEKFKKFDAPNGWGLYVHFVPWVEEYLAACEAHPEAAVKASR